MGDHARQQVGGTSTVVNDARGPVNTGSGHQFTGDGVNYVMGGNSGGIRQKFWLHTLAAGRQAMRVDAESFLVGSQGPAFVIESGWLAVRRRYLWLLMAFLDDAYRLGLLRVVGSTYQSATPNCRTSRPLNSVLSAALQRDPGGAAYGAGPQAPVSRGDSRIVGFIYPVWRSGADLGRAGLGAIWESSVGTARCFESSTAAFETESRSGGDTAALWRATRVRRFCGGGGWVRPRRGSAKPTRFLPWSR